MKEALPLFGTTLELFPGSIVSYEYMVSAERNLTSGKSLRLPRCVSTGPVAVGVLPIWQFNQRERNKWKSAASGVTLAATRDLLNLRR